MEKNKKQEWVPEEEAHYPFKKLTMDIAETDSKEHILVITDRFTGYIWAAKTGDKETGTTDKIIAILKSCVGKGLTITNKIKCDHKYKSRFPPSRAGTTNFKKSTFLIFLGLVSPHPPRWLAQPIFKNQFFSKSNQIVGKFLNNFYPTSLLFSTNAHYCFYY